MALLYCTVLYCMAHTVHIQPLARCSAVSCAKLRPSLYISRPVSLEYSLTLPFSLHSPSPTLRSHASPPSRPLPCWCAAESLAVSLCLTLRPPSYPIPWIWSSPSLSLPLHHVESLAERLLSDSLFAGVSLSFVRWLYVERPVIARPLRANTSSYRGSVLPETRRDLLLSSLSVGQLEIRRWYVLPLITTAFQF
jgi:hypothetical protein